MRALGTDHVIPVTAIEPIPAYSSVMFFLAKLFLMAQKLIYAKIIEKKIKIKFHRIGTLGGRNSTRSLHDLRKRVQRHRQTGRHIDGQRDCMTESDL